MVDNYNIIEQKRIIIDLIYKSKWPGHLSSAFSVLEILNVLYRDVMRIKDKDLNQYKQ